jgi:predicted Co/Zn/Cd cation transporter (cation efflux family)
MAPSDLDAAVRTAMDAVVERHGFEGYTSYAAKVGRGQFIEIHIVVLPDRQLGTVRDLDAIRDEIADALGAHGTDRWLTVDFTGDEEWT